jgi:hypothetical protein
MVDAPKPSERGQPLADALDQVAESLNSLSASVGSASGRDEANWPYPASAPAVPARGLRKAVRSFFRRLRRSRRLRYRLPRLFLAWTSFVATVGALVWVLFALWGPG